MNMQPVKIKRFKDGKCNDYFYWVGFAVILAFLFWRCTFGFACPDESFYLTIPYRLSQGDGLFIHEWHLSQISSVLIYPIIKLYFMLFSGTEGILLHFRWIFTAIWGASAVFAGITMRRYSKIGAYIASLIVLIYTPYGIMALSYNSLGILMLLNSCTLILTAEQKKWKLILSGALFSCTVLCCPYLLFLYLIISLIVLGFTFVKKNNKNIIKIWLYFSVGCGICFALFCAFVLSRCSISDVINAYPWIMKDPAHPNQSIWYRIVKYIKSIMAPTRLSRFILPLTLIMSICGHYVKKIRIYGFCAVCTGVFVFLLELITQNQVLNFIMFPITLLGFYCTATTENKDIKKIFTYIWMPGALYGFVINLTSNQAFYCISSAMTVSTFGSIIILLLYLYDLSVGCSSVVKKVLVAVVSVVLLIHISSEVFLRYKTVFWDEGNTITEQTISVTNGPEKGIKMSIERYEEYNNMMNDFNTIKDTPNDYKLLYLSKETIPYLCSDKRFATYSAWLSGINEISLKRLCAYYELNPDKMPNITVIEKQYDSASFYDYFISSGYYIYEENDRIMYLLKKSTD